MIIVVPTSLTIRNPYFFILVFGVGKEKIRPSPGSDVDLPGLGRIFSPSEGVRLVCIDFYRLAGVYVGTQDWTSSGLTSLGTVPTLSVSNFVLESEFLLLHEKRWVDEGSPS